MGKYNHVVQLNAELRRESPNCYRPRACVHSAHLRMFWEPLISKRKMPTTVIQSCFCVVYDYTGNEDLSKDYQIQEANWGSPCIFQSFKSFGKKNSTHWYAFQCFFEILLLNYS